MTEMVPPKVKNVVLEMSVEEFAILYASMHNLAIDATCGPAALKGHPKEQEKKEDILFVMARAEAADQFGYKIDRMKLGVLNNRDNI